MVEPHHIVFEAGMVRSLRHPKRFGHAQTILSTGRWPSGESVTGSDASMIARYLKPVAARRGDVEPVWWQRARELRAQGFKLRKIAEEVGVTDSAVNYMLCKSRRVPS